MSHADSLTVNQQRQCQFSVSQITDRKDETWSPSNMSVARRRPWSLVADRSTSVLQPQEMLNHQKVIDRLMAPASSKCQQAQTGTSCKL